MNYAIQRLPVDVVNQHSDSIQAVYLEAFAQPPYNRGAAESVLFANSLQNHCKRAGFHFLGAFDTTEDELLGFVYGFTCLPGQWWYERVAEALGLDFALDWLIGSFQVAEVAVHPDHQEKKIGSRLFDQLMEGISYQRAVLSTIALETPATHMYLRRGWQVLAEPVYFPGVNKAYRIMGIETKPSSPASNRTG